MTVVSTQNRKTYAGNSSTTSFSTSPVVFFSSSDLTVYVVVDSTQVATELVENTNYTVTGGSGSTGTINTAGGSSPHGAVATGSTLVIVRRLSIVQEADPQNNDGSDAGVIETALDKLTMMVQQVSNDSDRVVRLADSDTSSADLELPAPSANKILGWNAAADALENKTPADVDLTTLSAFGESLLTAADAAAARTALGSTTVGDAVFIAASASAARSALGIVGFPTLTASVGSNALTVTLASGTVLNFNDGTSATLGSAISVVLSNGSTAGTTSAQASKLWVVAMKNSGTPELAISNRLSGTSVAPIDLAGTISTTAEGGAGAADSAQVWYSTTARSSQPFAVVGYVTSTQATAGTWASSPTAQAFGLGVPLPGAVVQVQGNKTGAAATGTTTVPGDNTIPQNTEGDQYLSQAITPTSAANLLKISTQLSFSSTGAAQQTAQSLFQDSTANALATATNFQPTANGIDSLGLEHSMLAGTASSTTFKVRQGGLVAGTTTVNGNASGSQLYGGVATSYITIEEIAA